MVITLNKCIVCVCRGGIRVCKCVFVSAVEKSFEEK